jgi:hypothetical protein
MRLLSFAKNGVDAFRRFAVFAACGFVPPALATADPGAAAPPGGLLPEPGRDSVDGCDECDGQWAGECDGNDGPDVSRIEVGGRFVTTEANRLTPDEILRAAGYVPAADLAVGPILVRMHGRRVGNVYGPVCANEPVAVRDGSTFAVWDGDDARLVWYWVDDVRHVGLDFAVAPTEILRRAGKDPNENTLYIACGDPTLNVPPEQRKPVRVKESRFTVVPKAQSKSLVASDRIEVPIRSHVEQHDSQSGESSCAT